MSIFHNNLSSHAFNPYIPATDKVNKEVDNMLGGIDQLNAEMERMRKLAEERGEARGLEIGLKRGVAQGVAQGVALAKSVIELHSKGYDISEIIAETDATEEQIKEILS